MSDHNSDRPVSTEPEVSPIKLDELLDRARSLSFDGTGKLACYRSDLNRAVGEYSLGRLDEANSILSLLRVSLKRVFVGQKKKSEAMEAHLLYGSTLTWLGRTYERLNQNDEAMSAFAEAKTEFTSWIFKRKEPPRHAFLNYGVTLFKLGYYRRALWAFNEAAKTGTLNAEGNFYMGICFESLNEPTRAEERFREALKHDPDHYKSRKALANLLKRERRIPEAVIEYRTVILQALGAGWVDHALTTIEVVLKLTKQDPLLLAFKGDILRLQGDSRGALRALNRSLKRQPKNPFANGVKGLVLLDSKEKREEEEGIRLLERALKLDPKNDWVPVELAAVLCKAGNYNRSLEVLKTALARHPRNVRALVQKGETLSALERNKEALLVLKKAINLKPNDARLLAKQGQVLRYLNRYRQAVKVLRRSIELDRRVAWVHGELAAAFYGMGKYYDGLQAVIDALAIQPDYVFALGYKSEILRTLGTIEHSAGRTEEALQVINQALALSPNDAWALGTKGQVLRDLGRLEEAARTLRQSIELYPGLGWVQLEYSSAQYSLGKYSQALAALDKALSVEDDPEWQVFKAQILCEIGKFQEALETLEWAIRLNRRISTAFGLKGWALQHLGIQQAANALKAYQSATRLEPRNLWWHKGVANAFYLKGDRRRASAKYKWVLRRAERYSESQPNDISYLALRGWCQYRLGKCKQAVELFRRVTSLNVTEIAHQFDLALSLLDCGHYAEAWDEYLRGVRRSKEQPTPQQRGLLCVALDDLEVAIRNQPDLAQKLEVQDALALLKNTLNDSPPPQTPPTQEDNRQLNPHVSLRREQVML